MLCRTDSGHKIHTRVLPEPPLGFYRSWGTLQGTQVKALIPWWVLMRPDQGTCGRCLKSPFWHSWCSHSGFILSCRYFILLLISVNFHVLLLSLFLPLLTVQPLTRRARDLDFCPAGVLLAAARCFWCCVTWGPVLWCSELPFGSLQTMSALLLTADCSNDQHLPEVFATTCWATDLLLKLLHIYNIPKKII